MNASRAATATLCGYGIALAAALVALGLHTIADPMAQGRIVFLLFLPAALVIAVAVGTGPAMLVIAVGAIRALSVHPSVGGFEATWAVDPVSIIVFLALGALFVWVGAGTASKARRSTAALRDACSELRRQERDLESLHELSTRISSGEPLGTLLQRVLEAFADLHSLRQGVLTLRDSCTGAIEVAASIGFSDAALIDLRGLLAGEMAPGSAGSESASVIIEDTSTDVRFEQFRAFAAANGFRAVHSTPLISRDGEVIGAIAVHFPAPHAPDARERRLANMCARKAALLVERERALNALIETRQQEDKARKEADRRKDEFLATLAHELRNPLAPIRQAAAIFGSQAATAEQQHASRVIIERQVQHLARLLDDLLDVARMTRGALELRPQRLELRSVVRAALEVAQPLIDSYNHRLQVELPERPIHLEADPLRLSQVLSNLLSNAAKYTPSGGWITLKAQHPDQDVAIEVTDNGIGIRPEAMSTIFQMFSRGAMRSRHSAGLGIGLGLAKGLVELHGGTITAESAGPGTGTRFLVRLPLVQAAAPPERARGPSRRQDSTMRRIVVADDNVDAATSLAELLRLLGHQVETAYDGEEAIRTFSRLRADTALLDIGMPRKSGYEVARWIRAQPGGGEVLLAAITGWGYPTDKAHAERAGFDRHLTKPVDLSELEALLNAPPTSAGAVPRMASNM